MIIRSTIYLYICTRLIDPRRSSRVEERHFTEYNDVMHDLIKNGLEIRAAEIKVVQLEKYLFKTSKMDEKPRKKSRT